MAKKHFGKFITLAAIAGTVAAGISYFLRYKSFHEELDEEFHDFESDLDATEQMDESNGTAARIYVSLTPDKSADDIRETVEETISEDADETVDETIKNTLHGSFESETLSDKGTERTATIIVEDLTE